MTDRTFYRPTDLGLRWGVSNSTIRRWAREGVLPAATKLSERVIGWPSATVLKIEADRAKRGAK